MQKEVTVLWHGWGQANVSAGQRESGEEVHLCFGLWARPYSKLSRIEVSALLSFSVPAFKFIPTLSFLDFTSPSYFRFLMKLLMSLQEGLTDSKTQLNPCWEGSQVPAGLRCGRLNKKRMRRGGKEVKACGECVNLSLANPEKVDTFHVGGCPPPPSMQGILVKSVQDVLGWDLWK